MLQKFRFICLFQPTQFLLYLVQTIESTLLTNSIVIPNKVVRICQQSFLLVIEIVLENVYYLVKIRIRMTHKIILERKSL